ncbi:hypothetical protein [Pseudoflavitalea rhizosphaerae]|uniref:hypothetical protein n=1 Tax=Pseudoflavitalea rhizosphaerae TaxID=1884793 RepID=UPI000F8E6F57|nr:hypothetical protein [Pseudoflavitalea rhizosphaerae]
MLKQFYFVCALLLSFYSGFSQAFTITEADLLTAPGPAFTIPSGTVLCINADFCMGATSNFPGACANSNISSITVEGTLRIKSNITFRYAGTIDGNGTIEIEDRGRINLNGSINCASGLDLLAVDRTIASGTSTVNMPSCNAAACEPAFSDGYAPIGIVTAGLGYTSSGCSVTGVPPINTLPVKLQDFRAVAEGGRVKLSWTTTSEQNNKGFEVQRSREGGNWQYAGWVHSKALDGNSAVPVGYGFADPDAGNFTTIHYRLKQLDVDNVSWYSPVIRVEALSVNDWRVSQSGQDIQVQVQSVSSENLMISVVSVSGMRLYSGKHSVNPGSNMILIPAVSFSKGLVVVTLQRSGGELKREKILLR